MLSKDEYENKLRELGCSKIGSGLYSNVFSVPHRADLAIKVADLDAWPVYIKWATQNGHAGKLAPMVYSLKFRSGYYVAIMERLVCTIGQIRGTGNPIQLHHYRMMTQDKADDETPTDLVAFYQALKANRLSGDLHDGNVMLRHDGQMVVIDPTSRRFDESNSDRFRIKNGCCP